MYEFEFEITRQDCDYFVREAGFKKFAFTIFFTFVFLLPLFVIMSFNDGITSFVLVGFGFIFLLLLLNCYFWFFAGKKIYNAYVQKNITKMKFSANEEGVGVTTPVENSTSAWGNIIKVSVTKHLVLLWWSKVVVHAFLPKRIFASQEELEQFTEFVKSKVKSK